MIVNRWSGWVHLNQFNLGFNTVQTWDKNYYYYYSYKIGKAIREEKKKGVPFLPSSCLFLHMADHAKNRTGIQSST